MNTTVEFSSLYLLDYMAVTSWHQDCEQFSDIHLIKQEMHTVDTTFKITYSTEQYQQAKKYVEDMKNHKDRIFWIGKENKSDDELILSHIAHRILSGFYNSYEGWYGSSVILDMINKKTNGDAINN